MDHRAGLIAHLRSGAIKEPRSAARAPVENPLNPPATTASVQAEQAIFTSLRSAMGEGYRLVAMSPGITAEERAEITRRSPSHDSMSKPDPTTTAIASYRLASGRQCVAWSRYAGKEHTARGGLRVHTHLVVLETADFQAFACDPFRVQAALAEVIGDVPNIRPGVCLPLLALPITPAAYADSTEIGQDLMRQACRLADAVLTPASVLATTAASPIEVARWTMAILPRACRENVALSANLQYATAREMRLTCVDTVTPDVRRAIQGRDIRLLDLAAEPSADCSPFAGWFKFVMERWQQRRMNELCLLASQLDGQQVDAACLDRLAAIARDADRVEKAVRPELEQLVSHYAELQPPHRIERLLVRQLLSAAVRRFASLQHEPD